MAFPSDQSLCLQYAYIVIIGRALSNMNNGKSRHINRRHIITISQLLSVCVISLDYVTSKDNIADPQTKWLNKKLIETSSKGMRLKPIKEYVDTVDTQPS